MFLASKNLNIKPENCVYVGDHIRDIQAGNNAGMLTILAGYGYIPPEDKADLTTWGADLMVDNTAKLYSTLKDLIKK